MVMSKFKDGQKYLDLAGNQIEKHTQIEVDDEGNLTSVNFV